MKLGDDFNIGMSLFLSSFHCLFVGIILKECDCTRESHGYVTYIYLFSISINWKILNKICIIIEKKS